MTKHTPGPWVKDEYGDLRSPTGEQVSVWGLGISHGQRDDKREANANLIAAAPELLEALEIVSNSIEMECELRGEDPSSNRYLLLCRAAIAKAKGL